MNALDSKHPGHRLRRDRLRLDGPSGPTSEPELRTDAVQAISISTWNIEAVGGGITGARNANFYRYLTRGVLNLIAAVSAPQGSLLTALDLEACDLTNLGDDDGEAAARRMPAVTRAHYAVIPSGARDPVTGRP